MDNWRCMICSVSQPKTSTSSFFTEAGKERCPQSSKNTGYLYTYGEKCYQFMLVEKTWNEAKSWCYAQGASLMNLETRA